MHNLRRSGESRPFTGRNVHREGLCNGEAQAFRPDSQRFDEFWDGLVLSGEWLRLGDTVHQHETCLSDARFHSRRGFVDAEVGAIEAV